MVNGFNFVGENVSEEMRIESLRNFLKIFPRGKRKV